MAYLTDTGAQHAFTNDLHLLWQTSQKEMLATMLTAQANAKMVSAYIDGPWVYAVFVGDY
jgi:hypothetical protein